MITNTCQLNRYNTEDNLIDQTIKHKNSHISNQSSSSTSVTSMSSASFQLNSSKSILDLLFPEIILQETEDYKIIIANKEEYIKDSALICSEEFENCPFFKGLDIKKEDIYLIALEATKISFNEKLFHCVIDKKTEKLVTTSVGLSQKGKHRFDCLIASSKRNFDVDMFFDLTSQVELVEKDGPLSVYLFLFATSSSFRNKSLGSCIVNILLKDLRKKGFTTAYGETVNLKAEYIIKKNGADLYKSVYYKDYAYNGKALNIVDQDQRQTGFAFDLTQIN